MTFSAFVVRVTTNPSKAVGMLNMRLQAFSAIQSNTTGRFLHPDAKSYCDRRALPLLISKTPALVMIVHMTPLFGRCRLSQHQGGLIRATSPLREIDHERFDASKAELLVHWVSFGGCLEICGDPATLRLFDAPV